MDLQVAMTEVDFVSSGMESCSGPVGQFLCGGCESTLDTACGLHVHMTTTHHGGSYHYDNLTKTAFPKYDSCCAATQTSKQDKCYVKTYMERKSGKPPRKLHGVKFESEIRDNYITIKDDVLPHTAVKVKQETLAPQNKTSPPPYKLRHTSDKQLEKYKHIVQEHSQSHEEDMHSDIQQTKIHVPRITSEHEDILSLSAEAAVPLVVKTEHSLVHDEPTVVGTDAYDDTMNNDGDISDDSGNCIAEYTATVPTASQCLFTRFSKTESNSTLDNNKIGSGNKYRKCKNLINPNEGETSDEEDVDWSPNVKRRKKNRKRQGSFQKEHNITFTTNGMNDRKRNVSFQKEQNITVTTHVMNDNLDDPGDCTLDTKTPHNLKTTIKDKKYRNKKIMCDICGKVMQRQYKEAHENSHLGLKPFICDVCAKGYISKHILMIHMKTHDVEKGIGKYKCEVCGRSFYLKNCYESHIKNHTGERPFKCDQCDGTYKIEKHLKDHIHKVHKTKDPMSCDICGKQYYRKTSLDCHLLTAHTAPKFACRYCNRLFHHKKVRHHHELTHTGEKSHVCCVCNHGFIQRPCYLTHMLKQHGIAKATVLEMDAQRKIKKQGTPL